MVLTVLSIANASYITFYSGMYGMGSLFCPRFLSYSWHLSLSRTAIDVFILQKAVPKCALMNRALTKLLDELLMGIMKLCLPDIGALCKLLFTSGGQRVC